MTKSLGPLTEAILERDQPRTTDLFFRMVKREGQSLADALDVVTTAEAPFVQVPSHINVRDGQITLINNDHTILGLRTAASLAPYLPEQYRLLPFLVEEAADSGLHFAGLGVSQAIDFGFPLLAGTRIERVNHLGNQGHVMLGVVY